MWFEFSKMSVSLNLRENQGSIKNIFDLLPPFLPFSSCFKCILYIISFIYYILYYISLINWRWKKAYLTAYFTVNLSVPSCVSRNFVFGTQLSSSSTPSCMWLTLCVCIWFVLWLSFQRKPAFCLCYSISPITTSVISFLDII